MALRAHGQSGTYRSPPLRAGRQPLQSDRTDEQGNQDGQEGLCDRRDCRERHGGGNQDQQDSDEAIHTYYVSSSDKQVAINPTGTGVEWDDSGVARRKTDRRRKALLADAERVIRERYAEFDLSLADVAEVVGTSPRQLQRVFREAGNTEFRATLLRIRMEAAHRLLSREKTGPTVQATARAIGYRQASGLRQAFVRFYGYPPSRVQPGPSQYLGVLDEPEVAPPVEIF